VREALRDAMAEEMRRDETVFLLGEEVGEYQGAYKVSQGLLEEFGDRRVIDTPITEHGFAGVGVGAALTGLKPIVEFMTFNFAMQAIDHIINSAAKTLYMSGGQMGCSIVFRGPNGAAARVAAQHSQDYSAWYSQVPGLKVIAPFSAADYKGLLKAAIRDPNPVCFFEHKHLYRRVKGEVPEGRSPTPMTARVARAGSDLVVIAYGAMVWAALEATEDLDGASVEVLDLRSLVPLDVEAILDSVARCSKVVILDEANATCAVGAQVAAVIAQHAFEHLDAPVVRVATPDVPIPFSPPLERAVLPQPDDIAKACRELLAY